MTKTFTKVGVFILDIVMPFGPFLRKVEKSRPFKGWPELLYMVLPLTFFMYWLSRFLGEYGGMVYFLVIMPLSALVHIKLKNYHSKYDIYRTLLWYLIVIIIGFGSIWGFVGHMFLSDSVAKSIGWSIGSPFQIELAFYHLGIGIAGLLCIWYRDSLWTGVVVVKSTFLYGAAFVHIKDILVNHNYSVSNTGPVLIGDILFPSILLALLMLYAYQKNIISNSNKLG